MTSCSCHSLCTDECPCRCHVRCTECLAFNPAPDGFCSDECRNAFDHALDEHRAALGAL